MPAEVATPKLKSLAGDVAGTLARWEREVSGAATSHAAASADRRSGHAPTPFYDNLMSMIEATAAESGRVARADSVGTTPDDGDRPWRIRPLALCIAGVVVAAAVGWMLLPPEAGQTQRPMVTADAGNQHEERPPAKDAAATTDGPAETRAPAAEPPDGLAPAAGGTGAGSAVAAEPEERPGVASAAGQPSESLGRGAEAGGEPPAGAPAAGNNAFTDPIDVAAASPGGEPLPADAPSPPPPAIETGSVPRAGEPAVVRVGRMVSDANMRAGPSNGQAVLATIARGRTVEVIGCRAWCEVVFAGQRGWVYKGFIDAPPSPAKR